jgi:hypothetical protein
VGKQLARILGCKINQPVDQMETLLFNVFDAASNNSVDDIRNLIDQVYPATNWQIQSLLLLTSYVNTSGFCAS